MVRMKWRIWGVFGLAILGMGTVRAQDTTAVAQPRFAPKRILLLTATNPADIKKVPAAELEATAAQALRSLFAAPQYRAVSESESKTGLVKAAEGRINSKSTIRRDNPLWLAERSPAETTAALVAAGKAAGADAVAFAVVREGTRQEVELAVWYVRVQTRTAVSEGSVLRRSEGNYSGTQPAPDNSSASSINLPPLGTEKPRTLTTNLAPPLDSVKQKLLIVQMLTEWSQKLPN